MFKTLSRSFRSKKRCRFDFHLIIHHIESINVQRGADQSDSYAIKYERGRKKNGYTAYHPISRVKSSEEEEYKIYFDHQELFFDTTVKFSKKTPKTMDEGKESSQIEDQFPNNYKFSHKSLKLRLCRTNPGIGRNISVLRLKQDLVNFVNPDGSEFTKTVNFPLRKYWIDQPSAQLVLTIRSLMRPSLNSQRDEDFSETDATSFIHLDEFEEEELGEDGENPENIEIIEIIEKKSETLRKMQNQSCGMTPIRKSSLLANNTLELFPDSPSSPEVVKYLDKHRSTMNISDMEVGEPLPMKSTSTGTSTAVFTTNCSIQLDLGETPIKAPLEEKQPMTPPQKTRKKEEDLELDEIEFSEREIEGLMELGEDVEEFILKSPEFFKIRSTQEVKVEEQQPIPLEENVQLEKEVELVFDKEVIDCLDMLNSSTESAANESITLGLEKEEEENNEADKEDSHKSTDEKEEEEQEIQEGEEENEEVNEESVVEEDDIDRNDLIEEIQKNHESLEEVEEVEEETEIIQEEEEECEGEEEDDQETDESEISEDDLLILLDTDEEEMEEEGEFEDEAEPDVLIEAQLPEEVEIIEKEQIEKEEEEESEMKTPLKRSSVDENEMERSDQKMQMKKIIQARLLKKERRAWEIDTPTFKLEQSSRLVDRGDIINEEEKKLLFDDDLEKEVENTLYEFSKLEEKKLVEELTKNGKTKNKNKKKKKKKATGPYYSYLYFFDESSAAAIKTSSTTTNTVMMKKKPNNNNSKFPRQTFVKKKTRSLATDNNNGENDKENAGGSRRGDRLMNISEKKKNERLMEFCSKILFVGSGNNDRWNIHLKSDPKKGSYYLNQRLVNMHNENTVSSKNNNKKQYRVFRIKLPCVNDHGLQQNDLKFGASRASVNRRNEFLESNVKASSLLLALTNRVPDHWPAQPVKRLNLRRIPYSNGNDTNLMNVNSGKTFTKIVLEDMLRYGLYLLKICCAKALLGHQEEIDLSVVQKKPLIVNGQEIDLNEMGKTATFLTPSKNSYERKKVLKKKTPRKIKSGWNFVKSKDERWYHNHFKRVEVLDSRMLMN